jgi:hypothetical protein
VTLDLLSLAILGVERLAEIDPYQAVNEHGDVDVDWSTVGGRPYVYASTRIGTGRSLR